MTSVTTYKRMVQPADVDFSLRATIVSMIGYILDIAGIDADSKGFGIKKLTRENRSWVVSRMALDFYRFPYKYETIHITTWVNDYGKLLTTRNFTMVDENYNSIFAAVTQWAMIDLFTRRPLDLRHVDEYSQHLCKEKSPIDNPHKIAAIIPQKTAIHKVTYSDIDFNRHVNSLRYITLMVDMLPIEFLSKPNSMHVEINFLHESRYGDILTIGYEQSNSKLQFEIKNVRNIAICRASIEWKTDTEWKNLG
ncbi:MAG: acyl-ACP thioesterase [Prevotellaceae bacterium]|jgi:acyl-ACP thioesterase|nr:acyl-ACP thioesterase [Prevotellaceae bacterium]